MPLPRAGCFDLCLPGEVARLPNLAFHPALVVLAIRAQCRLLRTRMGDQGWFSCQLRRLSHWGVVKFVFDFPLQVLLHLNSALGKLLTMQAAGQGLQLATHSFFYAGAGGPVVSGLAEAV